MGADEAAVLLAAEQRAAALVRGDVAALRDLLHQDLRWTTYRGTVLDRSEYIAGNTDGSLAWRSQSLEDTTITVVGDSAVLTAIVIDEVEREGAPLTMRLRLTQTWVREGDKWRCLAGHAGPILS